MVKNRTVRTRPQPTTNPQGETIWGPAVPINRAVAALLDGLSTAQLEGVMRNVLEPTDIRELCERLSK